MMNFRKDLIRTFSRHAEIVNDDRNRNNIIDVLNTCLRLMDEIEAGYTAEITGEISVTKPLPQDIAAAPPPATPRLYFYLDHRRNGPIVDGGLVPRRSDDPFFYDDNTDVGGAGLGMAIK